MPAVAYGDRAAALAHPDTPGRTRCDPNAEVLWPSALGARRCSIATSTTTHADQQRRSQVGSPIPGHCWNHYAVGAAVVSQLAPAPTATAKMFSTHR